MDIRRNTSNKPNTTTVGVKLDSSFKIRFDVNVLVIKKGSPNCFCFEVEVLLLLFRKKLTGTIVLLQTSTTYHKYPNLVRTFLVIIFLILTMVRNLEHNYVLVRTKLVYYGSIRNAHRHREKYIRNSYFRSTIF